MDDDLVTRLTTSTATCTPIPSCRVRSTARRASSRPGCASWATTWSRASAAREWSASCATGRDRRCCCGPTWTPCRSPRRPACRTPARSRASCTPAATTCTSPACSVRPSASRRPATPGRARWSVLFQPAEETVRGAQAMVDDDLFARVPRPDVVLGQHVAPIPAGILGLRSGPAFAASDSLRVTLHGAGGHGSRPEATVDPVVMAAATVMRLQTLVSREVAGTDTAVVTVGAAERRHQGEHHPRRRRAAAQHPQLRRGGARATCSRPSGAWCGPSPRRRARHGHPTSRCSSRRPRWSTTRMPWCAPARALESVVGVRAGGRPRAGDRQRGRRGPRRGRRCAARLLAARRRRPRGLRRRLDGRAADAGGRRAAVEPLTAVRAGGGPDPAHRCRGAGRRRDGVARLEPDRAGEAHLQRPGLPASA